MGAKHQKIYFAAALTIPVCPLSVWGTCPPVEAMHVVKINQSTDLKLNQIQKFQMYVVFKESHILVSSARNSMYTWHIGIVNMNPQNVMMCLQAIGLQYNYLQALC